MISRFSFDFFIFLLGLLTRNSKQEIDGMVVNSQKKIYDAIAAASIFTNCAGIDTNNSQVITISTFTKFLETRQMEIWTEEDVKMLIHVRKINHIVNIGIISISFFFCFSILINKL